MDAKAARRAARERVAGYHEACLAELLAHVTEAVDRHRAGEIDVYALDETIHQYHRAAQELWKFCWGSGSGTHLDLVDRMIQQQPDVRAADWWDRGAPRHR
jgi:hypothetical protein